MAEKLSDIVERETEPDGDPDGGETDAAEHDLVVDPDTGELLEPPDADETMSPEAFEEEQTRHEEALKSILGAAWQDMAPCPNCGGVGHMPRDLAEAPPVLDDPDLVACDACNAYGVRKTPSLNDQYVTTPCTRCSGSGYRDRAAVEAESQAARYAAESAGAAAVPPPGYPPPPQPVWNPVTNQWDVIPAPGSSSSA